MIKAIKEATFDEKLEAMRGALKLRELDLLIINANILSTTSREILEGYNVGIVGPLIACVTKDIDYQSKKTIDIGSKIIVPGLIDIHVHFESSHLEPEKYAQLVCKQGTTTIFYDPHELANAGGKDGVRYAIEQSMDLPLRFLCAIPSTVPSAFGIENSGANFDSETIKELMDEFNINSIAEMMDMQSIINGDLRMLDILKLGHDRNSIIEGHARNLSGKELAAYKCIGIDSDHELSSGDDAINKLRNGMWVEIRGSHDHILKDVCNKIGPFTKSSRLTICTDDVPPDYLEKKGGIVDVIRRMISYGLDPIDVLCMSTINAAGRLKRNDIGTVTPGCIADFFVIDTIDQLNINKVIISGSVLEDESQQKKSADNYENTIRTINYSADDFKLLRSNQSHTQVNIINGFRNPYISKEKASFDSDDNFILPNGYAKMAVINRYGKFIRKPSLAIIKGIGKITGAIATSYSHDSHNLIILGSNDEDMCLACNEVKKIGGGIVLVQNNCIIYSVILPIFGMLSCSDGKSLSQEWSNLIKISHQITEWLPPYWTFKTIEGTSLACNPGPHLTDIGIFDGKTKKNIPIFDV